MSSLATISLSKAIKKEIAFHRAELEKLTKVLEICGGYTTRTSNNSAPENKRPIKNGKVPQIAWRNLVIKLFKENENAPLSSREVAARLFKGRKGRIARIIRSRASSILWTYKQEGLLQYTKEAGSYGKFNLA